MLRGNDGIREEWYTFGVLVVSFTTLSVETPTLFLLGIDENGTESESCERSRRSILVVPTLSTTLQGDTPSGGSLRSPLE